MPGQAPGGSDPGQRSKSLMQGQAVNAAVCLAGGRTVGILPADRPPVFVEEIKMLAFAPHRLRAAREAKGLSRTELAAESGRHFKTIFDYENRGAEPSLSVAARLCRALGLELMDLLQELESDGSRPA